MQDNDRRLGHHHWLSGQLFELLGGWVTTTPEAALQPVLAAVCHHHAWHAELFAARLPEIAEMDTDSLSVPADAAVQRLVDAARAAATTADRLHAAHALHERLLADLTAHLQQVDPRVDGPTTRVLTLALRDVRDDVVALDA